MVKRLAKHPKPATIRKREQRARDEKELEQLTIETHYNRLIRALTIKRMTDAEALDRAKVAAEVGLIIEWWVSVWLGEKDLSHCDVQGDGDDLFFPS